MALKDLYLKDVPRPPTMEYCDGIICGYILGCGRRMCWKDRKGRHLEMSFGS